MIDYSLLKRLARSQGIAPSDLLALAPQNDPFYVGAKRQLEKGKWFARIYEAMGSPARCHIRRVHYWLVTTNALPKPNGKPYENTQNDWCLLTLAAKYARYLGLVPIENIIDRRNPEPLINAYHWQHQKASAIRDSIDEQSIIESIVEQFTPFNPCKTQAYMLEVWAEKSTMNDVLEPVCSKYGMNLVTGLGELSITSVYLLAGRVLEAKKPVRVFYVSDFDPAGECMPVSVARKIEYFVRTYGIQQDIKLIPLMLTAEQCKEYDLPRTPIKDTELRKDGFEDRHGAGATELDALEALYPGQMRKIIEQAIEPYFDVQAWNEAIRANRELQAEVRKYLLGGECETCGGSGVVTQGEPEDDYDCPACNGLAHIPGRIGSNILESLSTSKFDSYTPPSADTAQESSPDSFLYSSDLEYIEQIDRYKAHRTQGAVEENLDIFDE